MVRELREALAATARVIGSTAWPLVSAAQMRALDAHTIETLGVPGEVLMETAGHSVVAAVMGVMRELADDGEVLVVCGSGNNGGDGFVIARHLQLLQVPVRVAIVGGGARAGGDAAANQARARALGVAFEGEAFRVPDRGVIVDSLFGTGLARPLSGVAAAAVERINAARSAAVRVVSVDLPSGIDADTGQVLGCAVAADLTVTISLPKLGLVLEPGRSLAGVIRVARIGIGDSAPEVGELASLWTRAGAGAALPKRPRDGHKGSFGHVLVVAGSEGKTGAAALAAVAAGRAGAGLVTIACPIGLNDVLEVKCTEAMTVGVADTPERSLSVAAEDQIVALAAERDVVAMGPGVGRNEETVALMQSLAKRVAQPMVIDADGLFAFSQDPAVLKAREAPTILTPHPGEAARLLGGSAVEVNRDRVGAARELAGMTGAIVVLKGAASVTAESSGRVVVNPTGGPALATGGTGDVLTGVAAALLAQGAPAFEAAAAAAYLHGESADRWALRSGGVGLLASDVASELPAAADSLRSAAGAPPGSARSETDDAREDSGASSIPSGDGRFAAGALLLEFPGR